MLDKCRSLKSIGIITMGFVLCGCLLTVPKSKAELSNLTLCRGWDDGGNPITFPDVVPPAETRVCICGHLKSDRALYLQVSWSREGIVLLRNLQQFDAGPLSSCIEESEGFEPGHYGVSVLMGKTSLGLVDFTVGEGH